MSKVGQRCCVPGCSSDTVRSKNVSFHRFPRDEKIKRVWVQRVNRRVNHSKYILWKPGKHHKICGLHFNKSGKKLYDDKYPVYFPKKTYLDPFKIYIPQENKPHHLDEVQYEVILQSKDSHLEKNKPESDHKLEHHHRDEIATGTQFYDIFDSAKKSSSHLNDHTYSCSILSLEGSTSLIKYLKEENMRLKEELEDLKTSKVNGTKLEEKLKTLQLDVEKKNEQLSRRDFQIKEMAVKIKEKDECIAILNKKKMLHMFCE